MLPSAEAGGEKTDFSPEAAVAIDFSGPIKGMMLIILRGRILSALTGNMLGDDAPPTQFQREDALRELANVICGNLLPHLGGSDAVFDIGIPQVRDVHNIQHCRLGEPAIRQEVALEGGRADLQLFITAGSLLQEWK